MYFKQYFLLTFKKNYESNCFNKINVNIFKYKMSLSNISKKL